MLKSLKMLSGANILSGGGHSLEGGMLAVVDVGSVRGGESWPRVENECLGSSSCEQDTYLLCLLALGQGGMGKQEVDNTISRKAEKQRRLSTWEEGFQNVLDGGRGWEKWCGCQWSKEQTEERGTCEVGWIRRVGTKDMDETTGPSVPISDGFSFPARTGCRFQPGLGRA